MGRDLEDPELLSSRMWGKRLEGTGRTSGRTCGISRSSYSAGLSHSRGASVGAVIFWGADSGALESRLFGAGPGERVGASLPRGVACGTSEPG